MLATSPYILLVAVSIAALVLESQCFYLPKRAEAFIPRENLLDPKKRPFCNAFTGCGKKRSNMPAISHHVGETDESLGSLLELSAEPAVEDLSRQIMSEAKLWEAIQEANMELSRRRQESAESMEEERPGQAGKQNCPIPPCYI